MPRPFCRRVNRNQYLSIILVGSMLLGAFWRNCVDKILPVYLASESIFEFRTMPINDLNSELTC